MTVTNPPPASGFPPAALQRQIGTYLTPLGTTNNAGATLNRLTFVPLTIARALTVDQLSNRVTSAAAAGGVMRCGIYADDGTGRPGALIQEFGTYPTDALATPTIAIAPALALAPGLYWLACVPQVSATGQTWTLNGSQISGVVPGNDMSQSGNIGYFQTAAVAGALPANAGALTMISTSAPTFGLRIAS